MGIGAATLAVAVLALIAWLTYVAGQARVRRRRREAAPGNLAPFMTDDELEGRRLSSVLASALAATAVLAIVLPVYYMDESSRQAAAAENFDEIAVERGEHWYEEFQCGGCHGPTGGGGGATYVEARSGISTTWSAPSLNDVLYRYDQDEVRYWLVYGRQGSPMPAWGAAGGGPLNSQQIDELIAYLDHIAIPQEEAIGTVDARVDRELQRLQNASESVREAIAGQRAEIQALEAAPEHLRAVEALPGRLESVLGGRGTCTTDSAALIDAPCDDEARDADRDGLADVAEQQLTALLEEMVASAPPSDARSILQRIVDGAPAGAPAFDPGTRFSTSRGGEPVDDLDAAEAMIAEFAAIVRNLNLNVANLERLLATATGGLAYLEDAAAASRWEIDVDQIAADGFGGDVEQALRGAGLYNAYCARCHTAGYSAGVAFTQEAGSGAFGPSLREGRSTVQFPDLEDQLAFVIRGSQNGQAYGVNGIGRGWMPGFGTVLSEADLRLIVQFERVLP